MTILPTQRDGNNKRESKWVHAGSWQAAVWSVVASWGDAISTYDPVKIKTNDKTAEGDPIYQSHNFPSGGDFKIGTGEELAASSDISGFDLPSNDTKYIVVEDSYGSIDRDYDDFYWKVDVKGIATPKLQFALRSFIKQNYADNPLNTGGTNDTVFEGDNRTFDPNAASCRTSYLVYVNPMDSYLDEDGTAIDSSTSGSAAVGTTNEYNKASSVGANGSLTAAAKADTVLNDNFLKVATGHASTGGFEYHTSATPGLVSITLVTSASNPLRAGAPAIDIKVVIDCDYTDPLHPTYVIDPDSSHTLFPCFELYVSDASNGGKNQTMYTYDSGTRGPGSLLLHEGIADSGNLPAPKVIP